MTGSSWTWSKEKTLVEKVPQADLLFGRRMKTRYTHEVRLCGKVYRVLWGGNFRMQGTATRILVMKLWEINVSSPTGSCSLNRRSSLDCVSNCPTRCNNIQLIYICKLLYMFRVVSAPISGAHITVSTVKVSIMPDTVDTVI